MIARVEQIMPSDRVGQFTTSRAVWHELEQFSSELNRAIYRTEVCTEVCAGAIYPNKSGIKIQVTINNDRRRPRVGQALLQQSVRTDTGAEGTTKGRKQNRNKSKTWKTGEIKYKQNITSKDSKDALVCCVENMVADRIMDSGASFHATYCKEELERFKLRSGKVRLADDINLDIAGVGDVVLKTSFDTSWTLKDVRYILGLKKRLISVWQLDEEGYHVGFGDQQWKVTKGSLVVARANKRGSIYMVEVQSEGIDIIIDGSGNAALWFGEAKEAFLHNVREDKETAETAAEVANGIVMLKRVPETPLQFEVAERLSRTFRVESTGIRAEVLKMLWAYSVSTNYLIYRIPNISIGFHIPKEEWRGKDTSLTHLKISGGSSDTSKGSKNSGSFKDSGRSDEEYSKNRASSVEGGSETPHVRRSTRESRAPRRYSPSANYLLLTENGEPESYSEALSSKESVQWKKAINEEMVSLEKNQTCSLVRLPEGKKASQSLWMVRVKEKHDGRKRYKDRLVVKDFQQKRGVDYNEIFSPVVKMTTMRHLHDTTKGFLVSWERRKPSVQVEEKSIRIKASTETMVDDMLVAGSDMAEFNKPKWVLIFVEDSWNEEPCRDVHQVGDEREVEVLRNFNWPPSELITEDGVLPERGYSQFNDVSSGYLVSKVS
ncbi:retrovirus-related pol polyprotein from transposon TNT 1-94 [Tanacetum coccineum]